MKVIDNLKIRDGSRPPCWIFLYLQHIANSWEIKYRRKQNKFGNSSYNRLEVIDNLKIQDDDRPSCWIFIFATYSLNRRKTNTDENKKKLAILATTE